VSNVRLVGTFTLRSPLSHIGEAISTTSYLVQEPILQPDGALVEVFCYSGNAWRGQLRDLCASYMLERLGSPRVPLDAFHLLFSGGRIGGEQVVDVERARAYRRAVPMLALFGGGVGNQILPGKLRVANCYPVCREAVPVLPPELAADAAVVSYRGLTFEKSFSRKDDAKDERLRQHVADGTPPRAPVATAPQQAALPGVADESVQEPPATKHERGGPADQMRMTVELLAAGARLATRIDLLDVSEVELGCLVSGLHAFSRSPHIGGQANRGHGLVALDYRLVDLDDGTETPFVAVVDGPALLAPRAADAKAAYDDHLRRAYDAFLDSQAAGIKALLGVSS
jgi:CRISPR type IV-associated protein Csf2